MFILSLICLIYYHSIFLYILLNLNYNLILNNLFCKTFLEALVFPIYHHHFKYYSQFLWMLFQGHYYYIELVDVFKNYFWWIKHKTTEIVRNVIFYSWIFIIFGFSFWLILILSLSTTTLYIINYWKLIPS